MNKEIKMNKSSSMKLKAIVSAIFTLGMGTTVVSLAKSSDVAKSSEVRSLLTINTNKALTKDPSVFHMADTNKIVLDIYDVDRSFVPPPEVVNDPLINKVVSKVVGDRVRMVIETKQPVKFNVYHTDKNVYLDLIPNNVFLNAKTETSTQVEEPVKEAVPVAVKTEAVVTEKEPAPVVKTVAEVPVKEVKEVQKVNPAVTPVSSVVANPSDVFTELDKINFKQVSNKQGRLTVDMSSKNVTPQVTKQGEKLIIDFKGVSIPNELQKRASVESLGTVASNIDVSMQKNNGRIILEQKEGFEYSFYQMEKQFVVDVKPALNASNPNEKRYVGKTLSLNFQNMDVRAILQVIADFTGLNIMSSDSINGAMTIRLKDVPWDQALDLVLEARNLQKIKEGNVIWIATRQEIADQNKAKLELKTQSESLEPLKLELFQVNYYKAEELKLVLEGKTDKNSNASLQEGSVRLISKRGSIGVDPRNNVLFIQDTENNLAAIKKLISKLDVPTKQVLVEAKIIIADDKFGKEIGAKFGIRQRSTSGNTSLGIAGNLVESGNVAGGSTSAVNPMFNLAAVGSNTVAPGAIGITLLRASGNGLGIELSALEQNNRGKVVSNPRLLTTDNKQALIEQGTEIPYVTPGTANSPATVTFKKAVLSLGVTPQIAPNGKIVMDLKIRKDTIGELINIQGGGQIPSIDTKNLNTQVTVNNGQTVVLGGVYEIANRKDISKIPFFGDLPYVGSLFRNTNRQEEKGELLIFITPHVVEDVDLDADIPEEVKQVEFKRREMK